MKYFPLIWAALWRKPARTILTFLAVTAAFTLFGTMVGFNASVQSLVEASRRDRIYTVPGFGGSLPLSFQGQLQRLPGVIQTGYEVGIPGYYQDKKNRLYINMWDDGWRRVSPEFPIPPAQWSALQASRTGILVSRQIATRYRLKPGDAFPFITDGVTRQDGAHYWRFTVTGVVDDIAEVPMGYLIGNYAYLDETRPISQRGMVDLFGLLVQDPARAADIAKAVDALSANSNAPTYSISDRDEVANDAQAGIDIPFVTMVVAGCGLFMILFLVANGLAQSVRERIPEFAVLKTMGFSDALVTALVFAEAAIPCLLGAALGFGLAAGFAREIPKLLPPAVAEATYLPMPIFSAASLAMAMGCAALVALLSTAIPVLRLKRLNLSAALAEQ